MGERGEATPREPFDGAPIAPAGGTGLGGFGGFQRPLASISVASPLPRHFASGLRATNLADESSFSDVRPSATPRRPTPSSCSMVAVGRSFRWPKDERRGPTSRYGFRARFFRAAADGKAFTYGSVDCFGTVA
jgi:hypothetical protein